MFSGKITLLNVRAVFPKYFKGQEEAFEGKGDPYWSGSFLLPKNHPQVEELKTLIRAASEAKFPGKGEAMLKVFQAKDKICLHDGDLKADKPYGAAYAGMLYVSARNNATKGPPPGVFDNIIDPKTGFARVIESANDPKAPWSGCYVNAILSVFGYAAGGGEGIGAQILGVQFAKDGDRLAGGGVSAASDFVAIPGTPAAIPGTAAAGAPSTAAPASAASLF